MMCYYINVHFQGQRFNPPLPYCRHTKNISRDIYCIFCFFHIPSSFYSIYSISFCFWMLSSTSFCNQNPVLSISLKNTNRLAFFFVSAPKAESTCTHANESSPCQRKMWVSCNTCEIRNDTTRLWIADGAVRGHINCFRKWVGGIIKNQSYAG